MVDRLEELLTMMDDGDEDEEEDEEEREDALDLTGRTASAAVSLEEDDGEAAAAGDGGAERWDDPAEPGGGETKRSADDAAGGDGGVPARALKRSASEMADMNGAVSEEEPERSDGEAADEGDSAFEEELGDGLVWRLDIGAAQRAEAAWRRALADRPDGAAAEALRMTAEGTMGTAVERLSVERGEELGRVVRHEPEIGLEGLYRQTVRAVRPAPQVLPVEQAGRTARAEEPGRTAALTVDELDRAVRRDSRRYDGGMTIF